MIIADIASGEVDIADALFLVALILFVIVTIMYVMKQAMESAITTAGLACVALAWLLL